MKQERETVMKSNLMKASVITTLCFVATCAMSMAQSTWLGVTSGTWSTPTNWSGNTVPASGSTLYFGAAGSYLINRNETTPPHQIIFNKEAAAYTFVGNRLRLALAGLQVVNYSRQTQTFASGLEFGSSGGIINTAAGDIVVEGGITGGNNRVPSKQGIGTLTVRGLNNLTLAFSIHAGTLVLEDGASYGTTGVTFQGANNSALELVGAASGVTTITKTQLTLNAGSGAADQVRLNANGGDGIQLNFTAATSALSRFATATLNVDLSSHASNRVSFASTSTDTASAATAGIFRWATVTDTIGTGFATMSGTNLVRNTATTLLTGADVTDSDTNYHVGGGSTTLSASRDTGSVTVHAVTGGTMSGGNLYTGGLLVREGTKDYTINNSLLQTGALGQPLYIHQHSMDGSLILNGAIHGAGTGTLFKSGSGTLVVGSSGRVRQSGITYLQGGRFVLNGEIERSTAVRVFDKATLEGGGSIGTQSPSAVNIYAGGILAGSTSEALSITGSLNLDSYAHFAMKLDYMASDFVSVNGAVTLSSEVNLKLTLASIPVEDQSVLLLKGTTLTGVFTSINGLDVAPDNTFSLKYDFIDYDFQIFYENNEVRIMALSVVPEPSGMLLMGMGAAFLLIRGWRRVSAS